MTEIEALLYLTVGAALIGVGIMIGLIAGMFFIFSREKQ